MSDLRKHLELFADAAALPSQRVVKPITDEQARILRAAKDGRLRRNDAYRLVIDGDLRPDRRSRERLQGREMLNRADPPQITQHGEHALELHEAAA